MEKKLIKMMKNGDIRLPPDIDEIFHPSVFQKNRTNLIHLFSLFSIQLSLNQNGGSSLLEIWGHNAGSHCCVCYSGGGEATLTWPQSLRQSSETDRIYLVDRTVLDVKGVINSVHGGFQTLSLVYSYWTHKDKALNGQLTLLVDAASAQDLT